MLHTDGGGLDKVLEAFVGVSYLDLTSWHVT